MSQKIIQVSVPVLAHDLVRLKEATNQPTTKGAVAEAIAQCLAAHAAGQEEK